MCENKSLMGFSLRTVPYFLTCLQSLSYLRRLLISAMRDPLGLVREMLDLTDLFLFMSFLKYLFKIRT